MDDKPKITFFIHDVIHGLRDYLKKKYKFEEEELSETKENILELIKNGNEVVSFNVEDKSIFLHFFDGIEDMRIEFYIDEKGDIQARFVENGNKNITTQ